MEKKTLFTLIRHTKRLLAIVAFLLWGYIIFTISRSTAPFMEQVPYCMGGTILISMLLTFAYKGLDYWYMQKQ